MVVTARSARLDQDFFFTKLFRFKKRDNVIEILLAK